MTSEQDKPSQHILIIGGGVAGNALALFLDRAASDPLSKRKFTFAVYEAYPRSEKVYLGGGLGLAPNGVSVLASLGLEEEVKKRGGVAKSSYFWTEGGTQLARWDHSMVDHDMYGMMRSTLYDIIAEGLEKKGLRIEYQKRAVKVEERGEKVLVEFADGSSAQGDYLIACDGIPTLKQVLIVGARSVVRSKIFPDYPEPEYIGLNGAGGFVTAESLPLNISTQIRESMNFIFGKNAFFGVAPASDGVLCP
jgi:2-polyprenyl-6-methoxyphenol hydroxylase-like FAD-dependent oxidoreductase